MVRGTLRRVAGLRSTSVVADGHAVQSRGLAARLAAARSGVGPDCDRADHGAESYGGANCDPIADFERYGSAVEDVESYADGYRLGRAVGYMRGCVDALRGRVR